MDGDCSVKNAKMYSPGHAVMSGAVLMFIVCMPQ